MKKTMCEVNWHYRDTPEGVSVLSHYSVTPIRVIREGVLPGCTGVSITAIDCDGQQFQGSPDGYHETEASAWNEVVTALAAGIRAERDEADKAIARADAMQRYLDAIREAVANYKST